MIITNAPKEIHGRKILFFDDYELYKIYEEEKIKVWNVFSKKHRASSIQLQKVGVEVPNQGERGIYERDF